MESDLLFDCPVKRRQLMGQTVYKSDVGYRSILIYLFQINYNYKSAFVMSNTFQRKFQHLVDANTVLQRAPTQAPRSLPATALPPPSTTDQIEIIQGRTYSSKNLLHAGHHYCQDGKLLTDGRQSWRLEVCQEISLSWTPLHHPFPGKSHNHPPACCRFQRQTSYRQSQASCLPYTWSKHQRKARCTPTDVECSHRSGRRDNWRRMLGKQLCSVPGSLARL